MNRMTRRTFLAMAAGAVGLGGWALTRTGTGEQAVPAPSGTPTTTATPSTVSSATTPPVAATTVAPPQLVLPVIERQGWGARTATTDFGSHVIERLTVHHTAVELLDDREAPARLRGHQRFHQDQGWPDIAYHFAIDRAGNVYEARPPTAPGDTFTNYDPAGHFLPVLEGDYDQQEPTEPQIESLVLLLAWAVTEFDVAPATVGGHRDYAATSCPGDRVYALIADGSIQRRVADRVESGGVELSYLRGDDALAIVDGIEA
jgi:hypothetical protein